MKRNVKKGFTLIELIAVLVILAVIALIVTPLVLNIVKKSKDSANKRCVDAYGKATELAVATCLLDTGDYPTTLDDLIVEYTGNEVVCNVKILNEDGSIYLSECIVKGTEVKDSKTEDGWYHYGKTTGQGSTYDAYIVGDQVTYNGMDFYVIANSDETSDSVTLLKAEPLTVDEVNTYGAGHVNMYVPTYSSSSDLYYQKAYDWNGYGGVAYYSSSTCGYNGSSQVYDGCTTDYNQSEIKYIIDAWSEDKIKSSVLKEDSLGYEVRLLTYEELIENLGYNQASEGPSEWIVNPEYTPSWVYNSNYYYWTMSSYEDSLLSMWYVTANGDLSYGMDYYGGNICQAPGSRGNMGMVRPVVTLLKSAI